jgi:putative membrane protein
MAFSHTTARGAAALLTAALLAAGCADKDTENRDGMAQVTAHADTSGAGSPQDSAAVAANNASYVMQEPHVARILTVSDSVELTMSQLAVQKATNPQVKAFAQMMVRDHSATSLQARELFARMGLQPQPHQTASQLVETGERTVNNLQGQTGAKFDQEFMAAQVNHHASLLDAIDKTMLPVVTQGEMNTFLKSLRTAVAAHLQQAQQIQGSLAAGAQPADSVVGNAPPAPAS